MFNKDKQKILLILKDKLIFYLGEELKYKDMNNDWKNKLYDVKNEHCYSVEKFEKRRKEQIDWSYEQWKLSNNNSNLIQELIKEIEKI